jgi:acid phosphatase family membrane protein YuiD
MDFLVEAFTNPILLVPTISWMVAQVLKAIINALVNKKFSISRLFGDGGMPSGHSATVTALATYAALAKGPGSFEFAVCGILAIVVCHDATGVRLETEKQGRLLQDLVEAFEALHDKDLPEVKLKRFVGHTPIQVMAGILLGIINACVMYYFVFQ